MKLQARLQQSALTTYLHACANCMFADDRPDAAHSHPVHTSGTFCTRWMLLSLQELGQDRWRLSNWCHWHEYLGLGPMPSAKGKPRLGYIHIAAPTPIKLTACLTGVVVIYKFAPQAYHTALPHLFCNDTSRQLLSTSAHHRAEVIVLPLGAVYCRFLNARPGHTPGDTTVSKYLASLGQW